MASLGHTGRRGVLGHTLNTLWHVITKTSHNILSKFMIFVLGHTHSHPGLQVRHPWYHQSQFLNASMKLPGHRDLFLFPPCINQDPLSHPLTWACPPQKEPSYKPSPLCSPLLWAEHSDLVREMGKENRIPSKPCVKQLNFKRALFFGNKTPGLLLSDKVP